MENIYSKLSEIFEVESVKDSDVIVEFECWDSLTSLSIIAMASEGYGVTLSNNDIINAVNIGALVELLERKKG
jgi:acyl carrier protein